MRKYPWFVWAAFIPMLLALLVMNAFVLGPLWPSFPLNIIWSIGSGIALGWFFFRSIDL